MKPALYISPEGIVKYISDCPEEPKYGKWCHDDKDNLKKSVAYQQALASSKQSAIECADQRQAIDILDSIGESHRKHKPFDDLRKDTIHPFPEDRYDVEVKKACNCGEHLCAHFSRVAHITPKPSPSIEPSGEGQEELWREVEDIADAEIEKYGVTAGSQLAFNIMSAIKERFTITRNK